MLNVQKFSWLANLTISRHLSPDSLNLTMGRSKGVILSSLVNLASLSSLDLSSSVLSSQSMPVISQAQRPQLTILDLSGTQISVMIPSAIASSSPLLTELFPCASLIEGRIPESIGYLPKLAVLDLRGNKLNGSIPPSMGLPSSLYSRDLSGNQLSGIIPCSSTRLSCLYSLDPSHNRLNGSIPPLTSLSSLKDLYLNDNKLSGSTPSSLGNLSSLRQFWLQKKSVSGSIPPSFSHLSSLIHLDVGQNQLNGSLHPSFRLPSAIQILDLQHSPPAHFILRRHNWEGCINFRHCG